MTEALDTKKIYSQVEPNLLLHQINRLADMGPGRVDLSNPEEFLQVSALQLEAGRMVLPHKHLRRAGASEMITQESWIVIKGRLKCTFYDLDGSILTEEILNPGDCSVIFQGGHSFEVLEEGTIIYEVKTGPYQGKDLDYVSL